MKYIATSFILLFSINSTAQKWFTEENQWIYNGYAGIEVEEYKNDLVIGNDTFLVYSRRGIVQLGGDTIITELPSLVVREEHDSVFYWNDSEEHLIYDFTMEVGDSINWQVGDVSGCYLIYFRIDSLYEVEIGGESIRVQEGTYRSYPWHNRYKVRVYEGIGVAEVKWQDDWDWIITGFLIPDLGLTCIQDDYLRLICQFSNGRLTYPEEERKCEDRIRPYRHEWFRESAQWINTVSSTSSSLESYNQITYGGDTIINNEEFRILDKTNFSLFGVEDTVRIKLEPIIVREENSKVYYWNGDTTYLIYDMDMRIGDTLHWNFDVINMQGQNESCEALFILDHVYAESFIYYPTYLVQHGRLIRGDTEEYIQIFEGIGWVSTLADDGYTWNPAGNLIPEHGMDCSESSNIEFGAFCNYTSWYYSFGHDQNCGNLVSSVEDEVSIPKIHIVPNPASDWISLSGSISAYKQYRVMNINGHQILAGNPNDGNVNIGSLPSGSYFLTLSGDQINPQSFKFIKI